MKSRFSSMVTVITPDFTRANFKAFSSSLSLANGMATMASIKRMMAMY